MSAQALPKPDGYVNDFAGVLDAATRARLEQRLKEVEAASSSEVAVATVTSLEGMSVEEYATRLFKEWGVGQEKADNGVLILVAPNDREMRIEVGYGLEGVLPDGLAGEIRDEQFLPRFRDDDYAGGISAGVGRIADIVEKNQVLSPEELARFNDSSNDVPVWILVPFLGMFIGIGSFMFGLGLRTKTVFPILFGGLFSGIPMLMALLVMFTVTLYTLAPLWLAMAATGYWLGSRKKWKDSFRPGKGGGKGSSGSGSGWVMGGGSSGGSSSGGSSGGSSSFGGGSSGGGGASGRW
ncbi:MAG: TPM domain-containing protein [Acidobacteriota bacterium]|nr:TPM domain-containing protein [Acidobacteriota bacterium]